MSVPPDKELVFVCHCRPGRRPAGYEPRYDNEGDDPLDLVTLDQKPIRTVSDEAHFVDVDCPDATLERNKWSDIPDRSVQIVWGEHCPVYPVLRGEDDADNALYDILRNARPKLKDSGMVVFPTMMIPLDEIANFTLDGWRTEVTAEFPFMVRHVGRAERSSGFIIFRPTNSGGRRRGTRRKGSSGTRRKGSSGTRRKGSSGTRRRKLRRRTRRRRPA